MSTAYPVVAFYSHNDYVDFVMTLILVMIIFSLTIVNFYTWYLHFRMRRGYFYRGILVAIFTVFFVVMCRIGLILGQGLPDPVNQTNIDLTRAWFQQIIQPGIVVLLAWRLQGIVDINIYFKIFQLAAYGLFIASVAITTYREYLDAKYDNPDSVNNGVRNKLSSSLIFISMVFDGACTGTYLYALNRVVGNNKAFNMRWIFFNVIIRSFLAFSVGLLFAILDDALSASSTGPLLQLANSLTITFLLQLANDLKGQHLAAFGNSNEKNSSNLDHSEGHTAEGLLKLFENKEFTDNFAAFLKTRFCEESLLYILASRDYRKNYERLEVKERQKGMEKLVDEFVRDSGEFSINIKGTERSMIISTFEEGKRELDKGKSNPDAFSPVCLDGADKDVLQMLVHGSYPLFLKANDKFVQAQPDKSVKSAEMIINVI